MRITKKALSILVLATVLALVFTATGYAVKPDWVTGFVPFESLVEGPEYLEYDFCDPYLVGHASQPIESPRKAVQGTVYVSPLLETSCLEPSTHFPESTGTCDYMLIPVEEPGNPDSKEGKATILQCTGDLEGLHATYKIHFDFTYEGGYHGHP